MQPTFDLFGITVSQYLQDTAQAPSLTTSVLFAGNTGQLGSPED